MNAYIEIPEGTVCTITKTGSTFEWGEDDLVAIDGTDGPNILILGGTVSVPATSIRTAG